MKSTIIFLFLSIFSDSLFSQDYLPTIEEGKKWTLIAPSNENGSDFIIPQITCDTIQRNSKVYNYLRCGFGPCFYDAYVREDTSNQQVFYLDPMDDNQEYLFLDYQLSVGDSFQILPNFQPVVDSVYSDFIFGRIRKVIEFDSLLTFIEGVGSNLYGCIPPFQGESNLNSVGEVACDEIFTSTEEIIGNKVLVYPNPNDGTFSIKISEEVLNDPFAVVRIWSMTGDLLFQEELNFTSVNIHLPQLTFNNIIVQIISSHQQFTEIVSIR